MAYNTYNRTSAPFLLSLLLFAAASPSARGAGPNVGLTVGGQLCCTSTGNCPGQGVAGAPVVLNCTFLGFTNTVGRSTTDATGAFNITVPSLAGFIVGLPLIPCAVSVQLPLEAAAACPALSTATGVLTSGIRLVGTVVTVLGLVQNATITGFKNVN